MNRGTLILDMDGTIADTYNYPDWAGILRGHVNDPWKHCGKVNPKEVYKMFCNVKPLVEPDVLQEFCSQWPETIVYSMTPWDATPEVEQATIRAKLQWLYKHFPFLLENHKLVITRQKQEKNFIQQEYVLYRSLSLNPDWKATPDDTLVDDNKLFLESFIGKKMLPPWLKNE